MNKLMNDLGLPLLDKPDKIGNLEQTPWQDIPAESAVIRSMDNLIATYGEDFVLDVISAAYVAPGYEQK